MRGKQFSGKAILGLCFASFIVGSLVTTRTWTPPSPTKEEHNFPIIPNYVNKIDEVVTKDCDHKKRVSLIIYYLIDKHND